MIVNIEDLRAAARRRLPRALFDYIDGGAEDERTLRANHADFARYVFRPRVLVDVSRRDQSTTVLGERIRSTVESTHFLYKDDVIPVTVSLGFAVAETGVPADYEQMKHLAAASLAAAKSTGRNRVVLHALAARPFEQAG